MRLIVLIEPDHRAGQTPRVAAAAGPRAPDATKGALAVALRQITRQLGVGYGGVQSPPSQLVASQFSELSQ